MDKYKLEVNAKKSQDKLVKVVCKDKTKRFADNLKKEVKV